VRPAEQRVLSVAAYASSFVRSVQRVLSERRQQLGQLEFDKDDPLLMEFVASAANLRMVGACIPMGAPIASTRRTRYVHSFV
jgi:hypothetical protein